MGKVFRRLRAKSAHMHGERTPDGIRMGNSDPKADVGNVRAVFGKERPNNGLEGAWMLLEG